MCIMVNVVSKYGYLVKKVNNTHVAITNIEGKICQSPLHLIDDKEVKAFAYDKTNKEVKAFAKQNGFHFVNSLSELVN